MKLTERGLVDDGDADEMLAALRAVTGVSGIILAQGPDISSWNRSINRPDEWMAYHQAHMDEDPTVPELTRLPPGQWYVGTRDQRLRGSEFLHQFHRAGMADAAAAKVYSPFRDDLFVVIYRERRQSRFTDEDLLLFKLLYPHLAGALATRRALTAIGLASADGAVASVSLSFPSGELTWSTGGRRFMEERLGPMSPQGWTRLGRAVRRASQRFSSVSLGGRSQVLLPGVRIELARVPPASGETVRLLGLLIAEGDDTPADARPSPAEALLSARQVAIARDAANGMSASAIAEVRRLSVFTVRAHLRAVYQRLGVSSRQALARLLSTE